MYKADLVIKNGRVYTLEEGRVAKAVAVRGDRIVKVGDEGDVSGLIGEGTTVIDLNGKVALPGLTDTHVHVVELGMSEDLVDLSCCVSSEEILRHVNEKAKVLPKGSWIVGRGWDQERLKDKRVPSIDDLDRESLGRPAVLYRVCGHVALANTEALEKSGLIRRDDLIRTGEIELGKDGKPNGIVKERAASLLRKAIPEPRLDDVKRYVMAALGKALKSGLTCVHCMVRSKQALHAISNLASKGELPIRVRLLIYQELAEEIGYERLRSFSTNDLKVLGIKVFADGSLGGRTAALSEDYSDDPGNRGMLLRDVEELKKVLEEANANGLQVAIHAIGDLAVDTVARAIASSARQGKDVRHRIEHASLVRPSTMDIIKDNGILCSVQPRFAYSDFWIRRRVGDRRFGWAYPFKTMVKKGIMLSGSSDAPVEPIEPMEGVWAATSSHINPEERLNVYEAIKLYTVNASYFSFEEEERGTLSEGKVADIVVLDRDPFRISPDEVREVKVVMVIVGGKVVYDGS